jgi:tetratricopeptide (TPR) repeat protein
MTDDEDVVRTVYLTGQPGSGKTELARQYGEQFENATSSNDTSKPLVITLNANSEESLMKSVKEATRKLRFSVDMELTDHGLIDLMKNLRNYFRGYSGAFLLIIDDMFGKNYFNDFFPRPGGKEWGGGQVLVTTQDNNLVPACHQFAKKFSLNEGMTKEDALALLKDISNVEVDDFAEEIIEELQSLPLALACCATYVGETRQDRASTQFGWKEYLNRYREHARLESRSFSNNNNVYPFSMTTATTMAVERMAETSDVLRLTFSFLSYCELLPVPLNVLAHHVMENLPVQNDKQSATKEDRISEIENEISRCTLLVHGRSQNLEIIKCHQVIYHAFQSVENTKPAEQREIEFVKMMKSLNETLDFMDNTCKEDVLLKVLVRPHLKSFVDHANDMSWNDTAEFVLISMKKGQFLFSTSDIPDEKAVKSLELLYNISSELDLPNEGRCDILANLGFYYLELDRDEDALNFLCKAYYMTEGKSDQEWLLLRCRISYNLARTYYNMDSVGLAVAHLKSFVDHANDMSWNDTAEFVLISMKKGQFLFSTSDIPDEKAVKSLELLYNISSELDLPNEGRCDILANLGFYYLELDRDEDALNFLCKAYYMTEGKSDQEWLLLRCRISYNLARTYYNMDSVGLAVEMMKRSIDLAKNVYVKEEDKIMNRFVWLSHFCFFGKKFWKLGAIVKEATEFLSNCAPDSESFSRARCLHELSGVYLCGIIECAFKPWKYWKHLKLVENCMNKSLNMYEHVLGADVASSSEYCELLAYSAILKLQANPTEARTQVEKALEYCNQNGDKLNYSCIIAIKKHLVDNLSWWRYLLYWIRNLPRGRLISAAYVNICDDILEDYNTGRISPSRRIINTIKTARNIYIWHNYVVVYLVASIIYRHFCSMFFR